MVNVAQPFLYWIFKYLLCFFDILGIFQDKNNNLKTTFVLDEFEM